jgi:hypothetical protein
MSHWACAVAARAQRTRRVRVRMRESIPEG